MIEDWLANAYEGMSRRQFIARMSITGISLAGFAMAANSVAGEVITTPVAGLAVADGKISSGDFRIPIYEARPSATGKYPVVPTRFPMNGLWGTLTPLWPMLNSIRRGRPIESA